MKIFYIGSRGALSMQPLQYLLQSEHQVCGVAVATPAAVSAGDVRLPVSIDDQDSIETLARDADLPVIYPGLSMEESLAAISQLAPDLILVSCYGKKLPQVLLDLPLHGSFNFHPSRLPAYRGPVPLFWQFRDGVDEFGVSLHVMTAQFDAGPVVAQNVFTLPDGISQTKVEGLIAQAYVGLLPDFLAALVGNSLVAIAQNTSLMSYQGYPEADDFRVDRQWSARRIYNFICASQHWGRVYPCRVEQQDLLLTSVLGFSEEELPDENCVIDGDTVELACHPGVLLARLASD